METERYEKFFEYIKSKNEHGTSHSIGVYAKKVSHFLEHCDSISRRGYKKYRSSFPELFMDAQTSVVLCDFLAYCGVGYSRSRGASSKKEQPLEKLSVVSEKNMKLMRDYITFTQEKRDVSIHTLKAYHYGLKNFFEYTNDFTTDSVKRYVRTLEVQGRKPATISHRVAILAGFGDWLKKPIEIKKPKAPRSLNTENIPTEEEYERLLGYLSTNGEKKWYFIVKTLGMTGARVSELVQMKWEDILNGEVTLKCKGNKYRRFFFHKSLVKEVKEHIKETGASGYIAVNKFGEQITTRGIGQQLKSYSEKTGIHRSKLHPHAFRHFFAKMYLKKQGDVIQLAEFLGHSRVDTTMIYLQKSKEEQLREFHKRVNW